MNNITKKSVMKKCDSLANLFLSCATEWKALSRSLERTTDRNELKNINEVIKKRIDE